MATLVWTTETGELKAECDHEWWELSGGWSECAGCGKLKRFEEM